MYTHLLNDFIELLAESFHEDLIVHVLITSILGFFLFIPLLLFQEMLLLELIIFLLFFLGILEQVIDGLANTLL